MMTYSYMPKNISEDKFLDLRINWLIKNKKDKILENFLNKKKQKKLLSYYNSYLLKEPQTSVTAFHFTVTVALLLLMQARNICGG